MYLGTDGRILVRDGNTPERLRLLTATGSAYPGFSSLVATDAHSGTVGVSEVISTIHLYEDNKILIGGNFTKFGGTAVTPPIRLNADGTIDNTTPFVSGNEKFLSQQPTSTVPNNVGVQSDGKIIGYLNDAPPTTYGGTAISAYPIRVNSDGSLDETWNIGGSGAASTNPSYPGVVSIYVLPDDKVLISGAFDSYNGVTKGGICRLNADGTLDNTFNTGGSGLSPGFTIISGIDVTNDGKILLGIEVSDGAGLTYNGIPINGPIRLNTDGTLDETFSIESFSGEIRHLTGLSDGKILAGGPSFTTLNGENVSKGLARLGNYYQFQKENGIYIYRTIETGSGPKIIKEFLFK
jgi:uncharacterized delta-60 repeat protein